MGRVHGVPGVAFRAMQKKRGAATVATVPFGFLDLAQEEPWHEGLCKYMNPVQEESGGRFFSFQCHIYVQCLRDGAKNIC